MSLGYVLSAEDLPRRRSGESSAEQLYREQLLKFQSLYGVKDENREDAPLYATNFSLPYLPSRIWRELGDGRRSGFCS